MYLNKLLFCVLVTLIWKEGSSKECSDCKKYSLCKPALDLVLKRKDSYTKNKFQQSLCGYDDDSREHKICCSDFDESPSLMDRSGSLTDTPPPIRKDHSNKLSLLPESCGDIDGNRIVGGTVAKIYEFPWMALISYNTRLGPKFKCGGSIINSRYILTAAHCVQGEDIAGVRLGEHDLRYPTDCQGEDDNLICESHLQNIAVQDKIIYEDYQGQPFVRNDIALLRLQDEIDFGFKNVGPICLPVLPALRNKSLDGEKATVAGWGVTEEGDTSAELLKVVVPIKSQNICRDFINRQVTDGEDRTGNQFCAGDHKKDSCEGDSGGPLILEEDYNGVDRFVQFGIVSHGPRTCGFHSPGVYTDVRKYVDWILDKIKP